MNIGGTVIEAAALVTVVTFLVSQLKPFVEQIPFARVGSPMHDASVQLLNVLLNVALVYAIAAGTGSLTLASALPLGIQALAQMAGAETLYKRATRSGGSVNDQGSVAAATVAVAEQPSNL